MSSLIHKSSFFNGSNSKIENSRRNSALILFELIWFVGNESILTAISALISTYENLREFSFLFSTVRFILSIFLHSVNCETIYWRWWKLWQMSGHKRASSLLSYMMITYKKQWKHIKKSGKEMPAKLSYSCFTFSKSNHNKWGTLLSTHTKNGEILLGISRTKNARLPIRFYCGPWTLDTSLRTLEIKNFHNHPTRVVVCTALCKYSGTGKTINYARPKNQYKIRLKNNFENAIIIVVVEYVGGGILPLGGEFHIYLI